MAGRPSKLSPEVIIAICSRLEAGVPAKLAAEAAGIGERTLYDWIRRAGTDRDPDGVYSDFATQMRESKAKGETGWFALLQKQAKGTVCKECGGSKGDIRGTMFALERLWPERWGNKLDVRVSQALSVQVEIAVGKLEREFAEEPAILERVLAALAGDEPAAVLEAELVEEG